MKDLRKAIADGEAREVDVEVASLLLMGMAENLGYLTMMDPVHSFEDGGEILLDFMRRGLLLQRSGIRGGRKTVGLTDTGGIAVNLEDLRIGGTHYFDGNIGEGKYALPQRISCGYKCKQCQSDSRSGDHGLR